MKKIVVSKRGSSKDKNRRRRTGREPGLRCRRLNGSAWRQGAGEASDVDARIALIQELIPLGLLAVHDELQDEVDRLAGEWYSRQGGQPEVDRWGWQQGSVYLADQKVPVDVPRVRDRRRGEIRLQSYERLQTPRNLDEGLVRRIVSGLSPACSRQVPELSGVRRGGAGGVWVVARLQQAGPRPYLGGRFGPPSGS